MIQQLQLQSEPIQSVQMTEPIVLCAADDNYVKPLTVTLTSAAQNIEQNRTLQIIILDGGISESNWSGLKESLVDLSVSIYSIRPGLEDVHDLGISHHITHTAYLRLLAGRLLPKTIDRVIYLDSDLLVCDDLCKLWDIPLEGNYALAVPDIACPFVDSRYVECNYTKSSPYFASLSPIANWDELGISPDTPYFNSGVMVLNIERMRNENVEHKLLSCLRENHKFVWCWDQYALNVVFANQWKPLPLKWNQGAHAFEFPDSTYSPIARSEFEEAVASPSIIHFTTEWKPWDFGSNHPLRQKFFEQLDLTAWSGWRPEKPPFSLTKKWQQFATEFVKQWVIHYRKIVNFKHKTKPVPRPNQTRQLRWDAQFKTGQLTIFAIPKPFIGSADIAQRNAIQSWKRLSPQVEILLLGNELGVAEVAKEFGVRHIPDIEINANGTPLVGSAFSLAHQASTTPYLAYCNCDIIIFDDFAKAVDRLARSTELDDFLAIGRRTNLPVERTVDFRNKEQVTQLALEAKKHGKLDSVVCKDFFVFNRGLFNDIPNFAVGRGNWDNWIVHNAKERRIPVVSVTDSVLVLHQNHDYEHLMGGRLSVYVNGPEARQNEKLGNGKHLISGSTSDFRLDADGLRPSRMKSLGGEFWRDFPKFAQLLVKIVGNR